MPPMPVIMNTNHDDLGLREGYMREALNMVKPPHAPERPRTKTFNTGRAGAHVR